MNWVLVVLLGLSVVGLYVYGSKLRRVQQEAPTLSPIDFPDYRSASSASIAVIIPAYNEADNIADCVLAVLTGTTLAADRLSLWVVDDQSTDRTWQILQDLQQQLQDSRLHLQPGLPRPEQEVWVGKNWACTQVAEQLDSDYLLFIDADVRLQPGAIELALAAMDRDQIDLLSCGPAIVCGCLGEWLAQPLIISTILVGFSFTAVNDPNTDSAFAAGPFMLFRRQAYQQIGGHRSVGDQVVEDVELARRVKFHGLKLFYIQGINLAKVQMYRSWGTLWEGWTKNLYQGSQRNFKGMMFFIAVLLLICLVPWLGLGWGLGWGLGRGLGQSVSLSTLIIFGLSVAGIILQYDMRRVLSIVSGIAPRYWWLTGLGGLAVVGIAVGSIIKTETGWGWTWRGRSLDSVRQLRIRNLQH